MNHLYPFGTKADLDTNKESDLANLTKVVAGFVLRDKNLNEYESMYAETRNANETFVPELTLISIQLHTRC